MDAHVLGIGSVAGALSLVIVALVASAWLRLGIGREIGWAAARAAVQLLAVGFLLAWLIGASSADLYAWLWIGAMVVLASAVVGRRAAGSPPALALAAGLAVGGSTALSLAVVFGFGIFEPTPINLIVTAGITIGNALPSAVLASNQVTTMVRDHRAEIEGLLSLGFDRSGVAQYLGPRTARSAMIPQVERTKVVGLIALPGAMVGLLLAGTDPVEAVVVQLLVMYLVLGSVAVSVIAVVSVLARQAVTDDLRAAAWAAAETR